jgi:hypothetical protein
MSKIEVEHVLRWFDNDTEWLVGEEVLRGHTLDELRRVLDRADDDPMINAYPVGPTEAAWLQPRIQHRIDRDSFRYVVEARQAF